MSASHYKYPRRVRMTLVPMLCLAAYLVVFGLAVAIEAIVDVF